MKNAKFSFELDIIKAKKIDKNKGDWIIVGYASTFDVDSDGMQITRQALDGAKNDLLKYSTVLFNHNADRPIGKVLETDIDNKGLLVKIVVSKTEEELWKKIEDGTICKFSISGQIDDYQETSPDNDGKSIVQITKISLFEVSIVSVPANVEAQSISAYISKSISIDKKKEDDEYVCKCSKCGHKMKSTKTCKETVCPECDVAMTDVKQASKTVNEIKLGLIQDLEILAGKLQDENKQLLEDIISVLKGRNQNKKEEMKKEFQLDDTSDVRPVFQLNSSGSIDLDDKNTFKKQILKYGKWYHWNADGGYLNVTKDLVKDIVNNFKKKLVENVSVPLTHTNDPSKNTGEVIKLEQTIKGLDAVIEIKDETVADKIRKGLIKSISASIDPNYLQKDRKEFSGPVLLHAALVQEPYIKGMGGFIELGDDFENRPIVELEDTIENPAEIIKTAAAALTRAAELLEKKEKTDIEPEKKNDDMKENEDKNKKTKPSEEEPEDDKSKGTEPDDDVNRKKNGDDSVDLSDAEDTYDKYLKAGKIIPAQKDVFINLLRISKKKIELGDNEVDVKKLILSFLEKSPKILDFDENGVIPDPTIPSSNKDSNVDMPQEAKDFYMKQMEFSEEGAQKAWEAAKELSNQEKETKTSIFD